jgi:hypothetical protein
VFDVPADQLPSHEWKPVESDCRISPIEDQAISWVGDHPIS